MRVCAPGNNWSELYICSYENLMNPIVLFEGSTAKTFSMSASISNFKYIDVTYQSAAWFGNMQTVRIYPESAAGQFEYCNISVSSDPQYFVRSYMVSGSTFTLGDGIFYGFKTQLSDKNDNIIIVRKVLGYKK